MSECNALSWLETINHNTLETKSNSGDSEESDLNYNGVMKCLKKLQSYILLIKQPAIRSHQCIAAEKCSIK